MIVGKSLEQALPGYVQGDAMPNFVAVHDSIKKRFSKLVKDNKVLRESAWLEFPVLRMYTWGRRFVT
jgi:hypothetical protein